MGFAQWLQVVLSALAAAWSPGAVTQGDAHVLWSGQLSPAGAPVELYSEGGQLTLRTLSTSLALGAFLAGMVVAGSEYRHQAMAELIPFREVFASLFFVTVGMLFDGRVLIGDVGGVLGLLAVILFGKFLIVS